jgi:hypothetical protein
MIPLQFHLIWEGKRFPFVNRLAIESLIQTHPHAKIILHFGNPPDNEHWIALQSKVEMRAIDVDALLQNVPDPEGIRRTLEGMAANYPAGRSNILRYLILYKEGGIYLDFDTITIRSLEPLCQYEGFIGQERVWKCDDDRVQGKWTLEMLWASPAFGLSYFLSRLNHKYLGSLKVLDWLDAKIQTLWGADQLNNAVLACKPQSQFFAKVLEAIPSTDPKIRYNLGPILMNKIWKETGGCELHRMENQAFYAIAPSQTHRFFCPNQIIDENVFLYHWCSSNEKDQAAKLEKSYLEQNLWNESILFHQLAKPIIDRMDS